MFLGDYSGKFVCFSPGVMSNPGTRRNGSSIKIRLTGKKRERNRVLSMGFVENNVYLYCLFCQLLKLTTNRLLFECLFALPFAQTSGFCVAQVLACSLGC